MLVAPAEPDTFGVRPLLPRRPLGRRQMRVQRVQHRTDFGQERIVVIEPLAGSCHHHFEARGLGLAARG